MTLAITPTPLAPAHFPSVPALFASGPTPAERTLLDVIATTAANHPHDPVIDAGEVLLTYRGLAEAVGAVAATLAEAEIGVGDRVGVRISSGTADLYVAILAVLAAGAAYVPVDADDPEERAELVFGEAAVCAIIDDDGLRMLTPPIGRPGQPTPDDDAWVIFTSGSTGTPKGVAVSHRAAAAFVDAEARLFLSGGQDKLLAGDEASRWVRATACSPASPSRSTRRARRCGWRGAAAPASSRRPARSCAPVSTSARGWRRSRSASSPPCPR